MKAAKDAGEEHHDPTREDNILGRNKTRLAFWEEHLKDPIVALDKAEVCGKFVLEVSARVIGGRSVLKWPVLASLKVCGKPIWEGVWPFLDPMDSVCLRTASMEWNVPGKHGPHGELSFFLIKKDLATMPVFAADIHTPFFFCADVLKKCALMALHLIIAEEGKDSESGCRIPDLGDTWRLGCPQRRVQCGKVKVKHGLKTKAFLQVILERTMCATMRCASSGCMSLVTRSLFS